MTWYANEILAQCNDKLLTAVLSEPKLARHAYLIRETIRYSSDEVKIEFYPPQGGLLVIKPVCDPDSRGAKWSDTDVLDWACLHGPADLPVILPESFGDLLDEDMVELLPPLALLRYLKQLARDTAADLVFFSCSMWGGDTENESCWTFGRTEQALLLQPGAELCTALLGLNGPPCVIQSDILSHALAYLNAPIASPFCVFHTRVFDWQRYRLQAG